MASTAVVRITPEQVAETLLHGNDVDIVSTEDVQDDMVSRILTGDTLEAAFASFESVSAKDLEGMSLQVTGVAWMRSAFTQGPKVYALLRCKLDESGDEVVVSMGGRTLMASFLWAQQHEAMPIRGAFRLLRSKTDPERSYWTFNLAPAKA